MIPSRFLAFLLLLGCVNATPNLSAQGASSSRLANGSPMDPEDLMSVPSGNYLVSLESEGRIKRINLRVDGPRVKCVNSTAPELEDIQGRFQSKGHGMFVVMLQGRYFRGTQVWIFRKDGTAAVREVPDRGEQQSAIPVEGESTDLPKAKGTR